MKLKIRYRKNAHQAEFDADLSTKLLALIGGYGCMDESSQVLTSAGYRAMGDILGPTRYLSWNGSEFQWSLGSAPYPKGKANLYRVVHEHGEFVASGHHLVFCADHSYRPVALLRAGDSLFRESDSDPLPTSSELAPLLWPEGVRRCSRTREDCQGDCESCIHPGGPRLRAAQGSALAHAPLRGGARGSARCSFAHPPYSSQTGDPREPGPSHSRPGLWNDHLCRTHSPDQLARLVSAWGDPLSSESSGRTFVGNPQQRRFHDYIERHQTASESSPHRNSCASPSISTYKESRVLAIEKAKNGWFWDLHVLGTNNYFSGGAVHHNSGKTFGLVHKAIKLSWLNRPYRGGIVAPSIPEYKKDVLPVFEEIVETNHLSHLVRYHRTDKVWTMPWGAKIEIATAEKRIKGPNWAWACINEFTLIQRERFHDVVGRVRVKGSKFPQIACSGTPEGLAHYVYEDFVDKPIAGSKVIYGDTRANAHNLDATYIPLMEAAYDPQVLQAYMMGLFVNLKGNLFYYSYDPARNQDRTLEPDHEGEFLVSLDFNVDPMCATVWQYTGKRIDGLWQIAGVDQIELGPQAAVGHASLTNAMCAALKARGYTPDCTTIYPDPAGKARSTSGNPDIVILGQCGYDKIKYRNAAPQFRKRQLCVNNLLAKGVVIFNPDKCPGMKRDFEAVEQDPVDFSKIKTNPKLTHHSDGFDYLADIEFPLSGVKPDSGMVRIR